MNYISTYCHIVLNRCFINGKQTHSFNNDSFDDFTKELYKFLEIEYPKFYKMDRLSKTAFLGVELLKKSATEIVNYADNEIALLFSNNNSSALTDVNFQTSYQNGGVPSPSLFVYTLPNILIGEIAIRNKWYGENMFTVSEHFDANYFVNYSTILLNKNTEALLCGWLNVSNDNIEAFLFFVSKKDFNHLNLSLNAEQLTKLFNKETKQ